MKLKRTLIFALAVMLIACCIGPVYAAEDPPEYLDMKVMAQAEIDSGAVAAAVGTLSGSNITVAENVDGRRYVMKAQATGGAARFTLKADPRLQVVDEAAEPNSATLISFDLAADKTTTRAYMNVLPTGMEEVATKYRALYFMESGKIAYFGAFMEAASASLTSITYGENQWYHFDMWLNYERNEIRYLIDGSEVGVVPITDEITGVDGFSMTVESRNGGANYYFDNLQIVDFPEVGGEVNLEGVGVPDSIRHPIVAEYNTALNNLGFNFTDTHTEFTLELANITHMPRRVEVDVAFSDAENQPEGSQSFEVTVGDKEVKRQSFEMDFSQYGFHYLETIVKDADTGHVQTHNKFQFAVLRAPQDGAKNPKMGYVDHTPHGHGTNEMERKIAFLGDIGISYLRTDYDQPSMMEKGTLEINDLYNRYSDALAANDMGTLAILVTGKYPPRTEAEFAEWDKYVEATVNHFKGTKTWYEVWNEYNIPGFNYNNATPEDYAKMLQHTYTIIKRIDPSINVCGFAFAPATKPSYEVDWEEWMRMVLEAGGGDYMDMASVHLYTHNVPEDFSSARGKIIPVTRAALDEFGYEDMKIITSEMGWSTKGDVDEASQASYVIRYMALVYNSLEKVTWYVSQDKQSTSEGENGYGMMRAWTREFADGYEPYAAKPSMMALSNWNALMTGAVCHGEVDIGDQDILGYQFSLPDGKEALVIWSQTDTPTTMGLQLDAAHVSQYDLFGNEKVLTPADGVYTFDCDGAPVYLIGDFTAFENAEPKFTSYTSELRIVSGDSGTIMLNNVSGMEAEIILDLPENITKIGRNDFAVSLQAGNDPVENETVHVSVVNPATSGVVYAYDIPVVYAEPISYSLRSEYYRNGRWQCVLQLRNNTFSQNLSGTVRIKEPLEITDIQNTFRVENLLPRNTQYIRINVPSAFAGTKTDMTLDIDLDNGILLENLQESMYMAAVAKAEKPPVINGKLDTGEWNKAVPLVLNDPSQVRLASATTPWSWAGPEDLSGKIYLAYDSDNFYIAAEVTDDVFCDIDDRERTYACDGLQFAFAKENKTSMARTEYGIAKVNGIDKIDRFYFMGVNTEFMGFIDVDTYKGTELKVTREGNITTYEGKFPWEQIYGEKIDVSQMSRIYFSVLINENDGAGRMGWIEYGGGIGGSKDAGLFIPINLIK